MKTTWTEKRLKRLFDRYNARFCSGRLAGWTVDFNEDHPGLYGYCDEKKRRLSVRPYYHTTDRQVRATLIHEMAHATTNGSHGKVWRREMERLKDARAPTECLDFLVPYSARSIVVSFMEAALSQDSSWGEAVAELGETFGLCGLGGSPNDKRCARILSQCKKYFSIAKARKLYVVA